MQLGILNLLLGLSNGAPTNGQGQGKGAHSSNIFAQLLGDTGQGGGQKTPTGGTLLTDIGATTLAAQEVQSPSETLDALNDLLGQEISADDAAALLAQFDAMDQGQGEGEPQPMLQELKAALTEIRDTKTPQTVGDVLAQLPSLQETTTDHAPAVHRMLAWMKDAFTAKQKDVPTQEVVVEGADDASTSPTVQSLQASMFRDAAPAEAAPEEESASRDYIEIVPLSATIQSSAPAWIKQITATPVRDGIDSEIPGLALAANDDMPEVNLPSMKYEKVTDIGKFRSMIENGIAQNSNEPKGDMASAAPAAASGVGTLHAPTVSDHRGVASLSSHGSTNHAPVSEQVHVAVQRATKEGIDQMTISLEPADLGRVEVRMHTGQDGQTQLSFLVDKAETLDSLARDARSLERMLQDAGVKADAGSMQFNLRQQPQPQAHGEGQFGQGGRPPWDEEAEDANGPQAAASAIQNYTLTLRDGVDIRA